MLDFLHQIETRMPAVLAGVWASSEENSAYTLLDHYTLELHVINTQYSWTGTKVALKILAGNSELHIISGVRHIGKIKGDTGFEYESTSEEQAITLSAVDDTVLALVLTTKQYVATEHPTHPILNEFKLFYEDEIAPNSPVEAPKFNWRVGFDKDDGCVIVDFEHATRWFTLLPSEAERAGQSLLHYARKARGF